MGLNLVKKVYVNQFGEQVTEVLRDMCGRVNVDFHTIPFTDNESYWFTWYEWTKSDQEDFIKWLTNYLYTKSAARREIMGYSYRNKKRCKDAALFFSMNYGWKTKINLDE